MKALLVILTSALALACGTAKPPQPVRDPVAEKKLAETLEERKALQKQYAAVDHDFRSKCEAKVGECLLQLADHRADFLDAHSTPQCKKEANSELEADCVAKALPALGKAPAATDYYAFQSQCYQKLLGCTAKFDDERGSTEQVALTKRRRKRLENSPEAAKWYDAKTFADERIVYLRGTLPPKAEGICKETADTSACERKVEEQLKEVDAEVAKDRSEYDAERAMALYVAAHKTKASCRDPEYECLLGKLSAYGATAHTRRYLEQNLKLLEKRQALINLLGADAAKSCLDSGVAKHQSTIIRGYKQYVKSPNRFFRYKLHEAFLKLHENQVTCLGAVVAPKGATRLGG